MLFAALRSIEIYSIFVYIVREDKIKRYLKDIAAEHQLVLQKGTSGEMLKEHVRTLTTSTTVVLLVDEYDYPILQPRYLTLQGYNKQTGNYVLTYPNKETIDSLIENVFASMTTKPEAYLNSIVTALRRAFKEYDFDWIKI